MNFIIAQELYSDYSVGGQQTPVGQHPLIVMAGLVFS